MDAKKAREHNLKVTEKIAILRGEYVNKYRIRVVERQTDGRRENVEDTTSDYIKDSEKKLLYDDYRSMYSDSKQFFITVDPIEDVKRIVNFRAPVRTDADREPPTHLGDPK